jgi:hypothetical protein
MEHQPGERGEVQAGERLLHAVRCGRLGSSVAVPCA